MFGPIFVSAPALISSPDSWVLDPSWLFRPFRLNRVFFGERRLICQTLCELSQNRIKGHSIPSHPPLVLCAGSVHQTNNIVLFWPLRPHSHPCAKVPAHYKCQPFTHWRWHSTGCNSRFSSPSKNTWRHVDRWAITLLNSTMWVTSSFPFIVFSRSHRLWLLETNNNRNCSVLRIKYHKNLAVTS